MTPNKVSEFFGSDGAFGLMSGMESKFTEIDGQYNWKGMSGVLQFFHKWPLGFIQNDWARSVNQIVWNLLIFVGIFGGIYSGMMSSGDITETTTAADGTTTKKIVGNNNFAIPDRMLNEPPAWRGFYFAIVTMTTLGFGDISPKSIAGQTAVGLQIVLFFVFNFIWSVEWDASVLMGE